MKLASNFSVRPFVRLGVKESTRRLSINLGRHIQHRHKSVRAKGAVAKAHPAVPGTALLWTTDKGHSRHLQNPDEWVVHANTQSSPGIKLAKQRVLYAGLWRALDV